MTILVTGGLGLLGRTLQRIEAFEDAVYVGRAVCDVRDPAALQRVFQAHDIDTVVHAAALTDHQCADGAALIATNVLGTYYVAKFARAWGARLVYLSTHYVYPGERGDYAEWEAGPAIGAYATSKLAGEAFALELGRDALVVRGSWYDYASRLAGWAARGALTDAWVSRERVTDAAHKLARLVRGGASGIYNIGGPRRTFSDICFDEGVGAPPLTRAQLDAQGRVAYAFPRDVSVNTAKYDAWAREHSHA